MASREGSLRRLKSEGRNGRDGKLLKLNIVNGWRSYLRRWAMKLNVDIDNRLCMSVPEAAKLLGISRNNAYELVKRGELPSIKLGKRKLIPKIALERKLAEAK